MNSLGSFRYSYIVNLGELSVAEYSRGAPRANCAGILNPVRIDDELHEWSCSTSAPWTFVPEQNGKESTRMMS